jgi:hypothetical protein
MPQQNNNEERKKGLVKNVPSINAEIGAVNLQYAELCCSRTLNHAVTLFK